MEAMAAGLPVVCSNIRGNVDLVKNGENGFLCNVTDVNDFAEKIRILASNRELCKEISEKNKKIIQNFGKEIVGQKMKRIYGL